MSIATHLVTVARSLSDILNDINIELVNKGSTSADTLDQVDEKIRAITGGGSTQDADAVAGDIRAGKTAYARGSKIVGTLASVNPGVPTISVSSSGTVTASVTQSAGIVDAATTPSTHKLSSSDDSAFVKENIKAGVTIFGVSGNYSGSGTDTQDANAVAGDIRTGKTAYVKGVKVTGTLLEKTAQTYTPGTASQTIPANRITTGVQTIQGDSNLVASNIKNGISIFGVTGNYSGSGSDTSDATASASDIRSGKTAYISTGKTTGTMSTVTAPNPSISVSSSGVITSSYSMSSGYTSGGNKSATKTLSSADDPAFIRENIKAGATIFGLDGNYSGSSGVSGAAYVCRWYGSPVTATRSGAGTIVFTGFPVSSIYEACGVTLYKSSQTDSGSNVIQTATILRGFTGIYASSIHSYVADFGGTLDYYTDQAFSLTINSNSSSTSIQVSSTDISSTLGHVFDSGSYTAIMMVYEPTP